MYYIFGRYGFILLPAILIAMYAQTKVKTTFNKYLRINSLSGLNGYQVARTILDRNGLYDVRIEHTSGELTDHYDPRKRILRLSTKVYSGTSVASIGVAAHEAGHAIQHANNYSPLEFRNLIFPLASFGSNFTWILIILGFLLNLTPFIDAGILLFTFVVIFQIITLPVEFNASKRALYNLENGILYKEELKPVKKVLDAAALTYVAATLVAVMQLARLILIRGDRD